MTLQKRDKQILHKINPKMAKIVHNKDLNHKLHAVLKGKFGKNYTDNLPEDDPISTKKSEKEVEKDNEVKLEYLIKKINL